MVYRILADLLVVAHGAFILYALLGGLLNLKWRSLIWIHIPAVLWGTMVEFFHWICPLTPLENYFRQLAGSEGYDGGFIEHYIIPIIYPSGLSDQLQLFLGGFVIAINVIVYGILFYQHKRRR